MLPSAIALNFSTKTSLTVQLDFGEIRFLKSMSSKKFKFLVFGFLRFVFIQAIFFS